MFRYGGPIREGIMSGMKNGGSMGNHEGPRRAALVGDPVFPKDSSGRAHHLVPVAYGVGAGLLHGARMALPWAARMGARYIPRLKNIFGRTTSAKHIPVRETVGLRGELYKTPFKQSKKFIRAGDEVTTSTFNPNWLGRDPLVQSIGWAGKTLASPTARGIGAKALRFATAPSTLIGGLWFANGRWFNKKGEELDPNDAEVKNAIDKAGGVPGGGDKGMMGTGEWFAAEAQKKLAEKNKADRKAKIAKYMDTMGYDRAQKTAVGKALIDASAIVQAGTEEGGSLKHADWGRMINQAIQATSKRLEKPEQIREAVGLMMTKAELEKDVLKSKGSPQKQLAKDYVDAGVYKTMEEAMAAIGKKSTFEDNLLAMSVKKDGKVSGSDLNILLHGTEGEKAPRKSVPGSDTAYKKFKEKMEDAGNDSQIELEFVEKMIDDKQPGDSFIIDDSLIIVKSDGTLAYRVRQR